MPKARLTFAIACMLSAAIMTAGCVAQRPKQISLAKTQTEAQNTVPARLNKASLVGCWTWLQEDDNDDWLCFDDTGHYVVVSYGDGEGGDNVGLYTLTPDGHLIFDQVDKFMRTRQLTVVRNNVSEIDLYGRSDNNDSIFMKLRKDSKNDFYKEITKLYF